MSGLLTARFGRKRLNGLTLRQALANLPANASWERIVVPEYDLIRAARL